MKLRQSTVEPVLGTLVNYLGMRRINTRGIEQADKGLLMAATAYNLKKLLKFQAPKVNVIVKAMEKAHQILNANLNLLFRILGSLNRTNGKLVDQF